MLDLCESSEGQRTAANHLLKGLLEAKDTVVMDALGDPRRSSAVAAVVGRPRKNAEDRNCCSIRTYISQDRKERLMRVARSIGITETSIAVRVAIERFLSEADPCLIVRSSTGSERTVGGRLARDGRGLFGKIGAKEARFT